MSEEAKKALDELQGSLNRMASCGYLCTAMYTSKSVPADRGSVHGVVPIRQQVAPVALAA